VFHDPDGTIASVRNELANTASGEWLCFLDADDELAPGYLGAMERAFEQEVLDGGLLLTPSRNHKGVFAPEKDIFESNWLCIGTLVPKDLFLKVGGFPDYPYGFEDWALWVKCVQAGARIVKVPDALYRAHRSRRLIGSQWRDKHWQSETHARIAAELGI
jgi:glycosyltransferase involved in cell wall biosynthesis